MKTKDIKTKMREYFFLHPTTRLRVRQIEREVAVPLPSVIRYSRELAVEGILKSSEIAGIVTYSADRTTREFLLEKKIFNIRQLFTSKTIDFMIEQLSNPTIILFGSFSRGEDTEGSDIDLYIETHSRRKINLDKYEKALRRKIQIFIYKNINDVENKELANNIVNGVILNGFLEVFK